MLAQGSEQLLAAVPFSIRSLWGPRLRAVRERADGRPLVLTNVPDDATRGAVHQLCEGLGLLHRSVGVRPHRHLEVRSQANTPPQEALLYQGRDVAAEAMASGSFERLPFHVNFGPWRRNPTTVLWRSM